MNGADLANHLARRWRYRVVKQTGSHLKVQTDDPSRQTITIPAHKPLKTGMLSSLLKEVCEHKGISVDDLISGL